MKSYDEDRIGEKFCCEESIASIFKVLLCCVYIYIWEGQSEDVKGSELELSLRRENFSSTRSFFHYNIPEEM